MFNFCTTYVSHEIRPHTEEVFFRVHDVCVCARALVNLSCVYPTTARDFVVKSLDGLLRDGIDVPTGGQSCVETRQIIHPFSPLFKNRKYINTRISDFNDNG